MEPLPALFGAESWAALHVLQLYMAPFASPFLGQGSSPPVVIDLDEVESHSHWHLCRPSGDAGDATRTEAEAERFAAVEAAWLRHFDRVLFAADTERDCLGDTVAASAAAVVSNALRPESGEVDAGTGPGGQFLFVGLMGFAPNADSSTGAVASTFPR